MIKQENKKDIIQAQENNLSQAMIDRLEISDKVFNSILESIQDIIYLKDPVGEIVDGWRLENGIEIQKVRIPIGVLCIIYESRPNVTIDVAALGFKSSNSVILRGGKEAIHSNKILTLCFKNALKKNNFSSDILQLVENPDRDLMKELLKQNLYIDLVVPRGGEALIKFVSENSLIPVVKHDKGVCHAYIHKSASYEQAKKIILNAKTQRPGVCNAIETLLIDKDCTFKEDILNSLIKEDVILHADIDTKKSISNINFQDLTNEKYQKEYLSLDISIKEVDNYQEAIEHILENTSSHSELIITEDLSVARLFLLSLDSAGIFINCSTRFHDGGQFGFGAEVGISTGKLHARGPMGIADLTTTKYIVTGDGQIRE